jgi:hypothetical protein
MKRVILAAIIAGFLSAGATADMYLDGAGMDFTWTNAQDGLGLFGQPVGTPTSNDIFFPFSNFNAHAADGTTASVSDTFEVDLHAGAGKLFASVTLITQGDYNITGMPGMNSVQADGALTAETLVGDPFFGANTYTFYDDQPTDGNEAWNASTMVELPWWDDLDDDGEYDEFVELDTVVTSLHIVADQDVVTISSDGGTADMTAYFEIVGIAVEIIPEPATLSLWRWVDWP